MKRLQNIKKQDRSYAKSTNVKTFTHKTNNKMKIQMKKSMCRHIIKMRFENLLL